MEGHRFDAFTRRLATATSRRQVLRALAGGAALGALARGTGGGSGAVALDATAPPIVPVGGAAVSAGPVATAEGVATGAAEGANGGSTGAPSEALTVINYFALGDSVASGHGLVDDGTACHRSALAYPFKVAGGLGIPGTVAYNVRHLACSGAVTGVPEQPTDPNHSFDTQVAQVIRALRDEIAADQLVLVSITIGANNFRWLHRSILGHMEESDDAFQTWVEETVDAIATDVKGQVEFLLGFANVAAVITQYHNPINRDSIFFRLTDKLVSTSCTSRFGIPKCYDRTEFAVHALNSAFALKVSAPLGHPDRLKITPTLHEAFHGHEGPGVLGIFDGGTSYCGFAPPGLDQTWVQYPGDGSSNSVASIAGHADGHFTGDCFHPNEQGAQTFADEVIAAARCAMQPHISAGPAVVDLTDTAATITWTTDQATGGAVEYGPSWQQLDQSAAGDTPTTDHSITLPNLTPSTTYHYRVRSKNAAGLEDVTVQDRTFATKSVAGGAASPEEAATRALTALTRGDLTALGALYAPGTAPATWQAFWQGRYFQGDADLTGCAGMTYTLGSWAGAGCRPTPNSTDVNVIAYFDRSCGQAGGYAAHTIAFETHRLGTAWYLAGLYGVNGNPPEFGQPCVDDPGCAPGGAYDNGGCCAGGTYQNGSCQSPDGVVAPPTAAPVSDTPQPQTLSVDLGNPASEAGFNLVGWGDAQDAPANPLVAPSGDTSKRFQLLDQDNSLTFAPVVPGIAYRLIAEVEDGGCADDFQILADGQLVYTYRGTQANQVIVHQVDLPAGVITTTQVTITFRNTATDDCGAAAVFGVKLEPAG